jgi:hypothetical protein
MTPEALQRWLDTNANRRYNLVELTPPASATPILRLPLGGDQGATATQLLEAARADAARMTGTLSYTVTARHEGAQHYDSLRFDVVGGAPQDPAGLPDAHSAGTTAAALGHVVRLCVASQQSNDRMVKTLCETLLEIKNADRSEVRDLRVGMQKLRSQGRKSPVDVELLRLSMEREDRAASRALWEKGLDVVKPLAAGILAKKLPEHRPAAVDAIFQSLTEDQAERLITLLGPRLAGHVLRARGEAAVQALADIAKTCDAEGKLAELLSIFTNEQRTAIGMVMQAEAERQRKANGKAHPPPPSPAGDASPVDAPPAEEEGAAPS